MTKKKDPRDKLKTGRPKKYNPDVHPMFARLLADKGLTDQQIADAMKITKSTLNKWKLDFKEFSDSISEGKMGIDNLVKSALLKKALGFVDTEAVKIFQHNGKEVIVPYYRKVDPDFQAQRFWLMNRCRDEFTEKLQLEDVTDYTHAESKLEEIRKKISGKRKSDN